MDVGVDAKKKRGSCTGRRVMPIFPGFWCYPLLDLWPFPFVFLCIGAILIAKESGDTPDRPIVWAGPTPSSSEVPLASLTAPRLRVGERERELVNRVQWLRRPPAEPLSFGRATGSPSHMMTWSSGRMGPWAGEAGRLRARQPASTQAHYPIDTLCRGCIALLLTSLAAAAAAAVPTTSSPRLTAHPFSPR